MTAPTVGPSVGIVVVSHSRTVPSSLPVASSFPARLKRSARTGFAGAGFFQAVEKTDALPKCACGTVNASWVRVSVSPSDGFPEFGSVQPRRFWPPVNRISYSEPSAYSTKTLRQCSFIVQAEVFRKKSHGAFLPFMSMRTCS